METTCFESRGDAGRASCFDVRQAGWRLGEGDQRGRVTFNSPGLAGFRPRLIAATRVTWYDIIATDSALTWNFQQSTPDLGERTNQVKRSTLNFKAHSQTTRFSRPIDDENNGVAKTARWNTVLSRDYSRLAGAGQCPQASRLAFYRRSGTQAIVYLQQYATALARSLCGAWGFKPRGDC